MEIATDLDIVIEAKIGPTSVGFEIFKIIKSAAAPHDLEWDVEWRSASDEPHARQFVSKGHDAFGRELTFTHTIGDETVRDDKLARSAREEVTGFVRNFPPGTLSLKGNLVEPADILYPLTVDTESVVTSGTTLAKPGDWNDSDNSIECVGAGGGELWGGGCCGQWRSH